MADLNETTLPPIPVTILTGFLGAGKTTLLNHILHGEHGVRVAVMVNDFGAINIDAQLVVGVPDRNTVNLANGCICCTLRSDLLREAVTLADRDDRPEYLIIEASGVSDPLAIVMTFASALARPHFYIASVLTVVDAEQALAYLQSRADKRRRPGTRLVGFLQSVFPSKQGLLYELQIHTADVVILNKVDLLDDEALAVVRAWLRRILPQARPLETSFARVPVDWLLDGNHVEVRLPQAEPQEVHVHQVTDGPMHDQHDHDHDHTLVFETWSFVSDAPFSLKRLRQVVAALLGGIYRAKGVVYLAESPERREVLQVVGPRVRLTPGDIWREAETPGSQIVVIGAQGSVDAVKLRQRFESALVTPATALPQTGRQPLSAVVTWLRGLSTN